MSGFISPEHYDSSSQLYNSSQEEELFQFAQSCMVILNLSQSCPHSKLPSSSLHSQKGSTAQNLTDFDLEKNPKLTKTKSWQDKTQTGHRIRQKRRKQKSTIGVEALHVKQQKAKTFDMKLQFLNFEADKALEVVNSSANNCRSRFANSKNLFEVNLEIKVWKSGQSKDVVQAILKWCKELKRDGNFRFQKNNKLMNGQVCSIFEMSFSRNRL